MSILEPPYEVLPQTVHTIVVFFTAPAVAALKFLREVDTA